MSDFLTSTMGVTWELITNANSQPYLGPTESESLEMAWAVSTGNKSCSVCDVQDAEEPPA